MVDGLIEEEARVAGELTRHSDAERASWSYLVILTVTLGWFFVGPLLPGGDALFGALTIGETLLICVPGVLSVHARAWLYRRGPGAAGAYRVVRALETVILYGGMLSLIYFSGIKWNPLWMLAPFTAISVAKLTPFGARLYRGSTGGSHLLFAVASVGRGDVEGALISVGVGTLSMVMFEVLSLGGRRDARLQAERNLVQARLNAALLDQVRAQVADGLREGAGRELKGLVEEFESSAAKEPDTAALAQQARTAFAELLKVTRSRYAGLGSHTVASLGRLLEEKCRPLCGGISYEHEVVGGLQAEVDSHAALALLRVGQELVRNAVTHGAATSVSVGLTHDGEALTLTVRDNGSGISADTLTRATGGLSNAQQWLREHGAALELTSVGDGRGTELRASLQL